MKVRFLPELACSAGVGSSRILFVDVFFVRVSFVEVLLAGVIAVRVVGVVVKPAFFGLFGFDIDVVEVAGI